MVIKSYCGESRSGRRLLMHLNVRAWLLHGQLLALLSLLHVFLIPDAGREELVGMVANILCHRFLKDPVTKFENCFKSVSENYNIYYLPYNTAYTWKPRLKLVDREAYGSEGCITSDLLHVYRSTTEVPLLWRPTSRRARGSTGPYISATSRIAISMQVLFIIYLVPNGPIPIQAWWWLK